MIFNILYGTKCTLYHHMFYHHAHMTPIDIWTPPPPLRWSWPPTEQIRWTLPCYVLVVWTERLSSPCLTAGRNVSFSPPSPVKWTSLRRSTWRTVSLWFNNSVFKCCFCVCTSEKLTVFQRASIKLLYMQQIQLQYMDFGSYCIAAFVKPMFPPPSWISVVY